MHDGRIIYRRVLRRIRISTDNALVLTVLATFRVVGSSEILKTVAQFLNDSPSKGASVTSPC
jgi:hypothetical protein